MKEEWKWIPGFESKYQASTLGRIKSFKQSKDGKIMKGNKTNDGRTLVNLEGKKYFVHRLVLLAFKPNEQTNDNNIVLHLDGDPTNNCLNNLKWGTYKENANDKLAITRNKATQHASKVRREQEQTRIIEDEIWKDIEGYEGAYQISSYGRVRSLKRKKPLIMSPILQKARDYYTIGLFQNGKKKRYSIDRLVAKAFVYNSNPQEYTEVNHIDENSLNNHYTNLEWCSHAQNTRYSIYRQSIPVQQYDLKGNLVAEYKSMREAERLTGVESIDISKVTRGIRETAGGYKWKKKTKGEDVDGAQSE